MTELLDVAWAAGLFEGEGCIYVGADRHRNYALVLRTTDRDVLDRFVAIVGCGRVRGPIQLQPHHKPAWEWRLTRDADRRAVLSMFLPYLGERRTAKARQMLALPVRARGGLTRAERVARGMRVAELHA